MPSRRHSNANWNLDDLAQPWATLWQGDWLLEFCCFWWCCLPLHSVKLMSHTTTASDNFFGSDAATVTLFRVTFSAKKIAGFLKKDGRSKYASLLAPSGQMNTQIWLKRFCGFTCLTTQMVVKWVPSRMSRLLEVHINPIGRLSTWFKKLIRRGIQRIWARMKRQH